MSGVKPGYTLPIITSETSGRPVGTISIAGPPAKVRRYGQLVQKQAEILLKEQALLEISLRREQAMRDLAESVVLYNPAEADEEALALRARDLGYDIARCAAAAILEVEGGEEQGSRALQQARKIFGPESLVALLRNSQIAALIARSPHRGVRKGEWEDEAGGLCRETVAALAEFGIAARAGVGTEAHDIPSLALSAKTAREALLAGKERQGEARVFLARKLRVEMLLASVPAQRKRAFAESVAAPLAKLDAGGELARTFEAWCASPFAPSEVARGLAIHRNTLQYRLKKIKEITGLDPWNFRDAFELWAALFLYGENARNIP